MSIDANATESDPPEMAPRIAALRAEVQSALGEAATWEMNGGLPAFRVDRSGLHAAGEKMKAAGFDYLLFNTATDHPAENRFEMIYVLTKYAGGGEVALVADVDRENPAIDTVSDLWPTAEWHEREVYDLFGIRFNHHGDLRRILLEEGWEGHPLRKDYHDEIHGMIPRPY